MHVIETEFKYDLNTIKEHPEVLKYFRIQLEYQDKADTLKTDHKDRYYMLMETCKECGLNYGAIADAVKLCKNWDAEKVYEIVKLSVEDPTDYIKCHNFVMHCIQELMAMKREKVNLKWDKYHEVKAQKDVLKDKGIRIKLVDYAYEQYKHQTKFLIKNRLSPADMKDFTDYEYLDDFVGCFVRYSVTKHWKNYLDPEERKVERAKRIIEKSEKTALNMRQIQFYAEQERQRKKEEEYKVFKAFGLVKEDESAA